MSRRTGGRKTSQKSGRFWAGAAAAICLIALFSCGKSAKDYYNEGLNQYKARQYELADNSFSEAIRINPENAQTYYARGCMYHASGRYRLGIDSFDQCIRLVGLNPKFAYAYQYRGQCYHALGDRKKALEDYRTAEELGCTEAKAAAQRIVDDQSLANLLDKHLDRTSPEWKMEQTAADGARTAIGPGGLLHEEPHDSQTLLALIFIKLLRRE